MMPMPRCMRLVKVKPAAPIIFMCCRLPCAQRRSRMATSISDGGDSSQEPHAIGGHAHLPSGAAHERRLDEVMREYVAAERLAALELRQAAALGKRRDADDGVVAPVIAAVAGPGRQAARDDRAVDAGGELLQPAEERARSDELRRGLQDAQVPDPPASSAPAAAASMRRSGCRRRARSCGRSGRPSA